MAEEILIGGTGGQGVLFIGRLLAEAGLLEGKEVSWLPQYGAEKRGGVVWCNVVISDEKIGDIFISHPTAAIAMSLASLTRLEPMVRAGGLLVVNETLVAEKSARQDITSLYVPATASALELGDDSVVNLVILGALIAARPIVPLERLNHVLDGMGKGTRLEMNKKALNHGYAIVKKASQKIPAQ